MHVAGGCFKYGCDKAGVTWELDPEAPDEEAFPNHLCGDHAQRPDTIGTFERPTLVGPMEW